MVCQCSLVERQFMWRGRWHTQASEQRHHGRGLRVVVSSLGNEDKDLRPDDCLTRTWHTDHVAAFSEVPTVDFLVRQFLKVGSPFFPHASHCRSVLFLSLPSVSLCCIHSLVSTVVFEGLIFEGPNCGPSICAVPARLGMPGSSPDWGSDPVWTGLDPGSGQVQGPVQHLALGSGSGSGVGWVCCEPGLNRTRTRTHESI